MCSACCSENSKYFEAFDTILADFTGKESELIPILQRLQGAYGYLPKDIIERLCEKNGLFITQVMGVATFYSQFRLSPTGEHTIKVCFGTACHVNGAEGIADALCDVLKVPVGGTTEDGKFTLESVACLGCCSLAPVMMIGSETYGRLTPEKARAIISDLYKKEATSK